jgi:hypothetical protein
VAVAIAILYRDGCDKDRSFNWLVEAFEDRDGNLPYIGRELCAPLELLRKLKLPAA